MRFRLITFALPFVFAPNVGIAIPTPYGLLAPSDLAMPVLYLLCAPDVFFASRRPRLPPFLAIAYIFFLAWALAVTGIIPLRYIAMEEAGMVTVTGLLKIGKFFVYSFFCYLLTCSMYTEKKVAQMKTSFLIACLILAGTVILSSLTGWRGAAELEGTEVAFKQSLSSGLFTSNIVSATLATALAFWIAEWFWKTWKLTWNLNLIYVGVIGLGLVLTYGRGGWVGSIMGVGYLFIRRRPNLRTVVTVGALASVFIASSFMFKDVKLTILSTVMADKYTLAKTSDFGKKYGIDDGSRIQIFLVNIKKISFNPFAGVGFFNRTPETYLARTGSHNFFLQMALETGLIGLTALMICFYSLWKYAGIPKPLVGNTAPFSGEPLRAAIVAAAACCMSGEYLYGGTVIFVLGMAISFNVAEKMVYYKKHYRYLMSLDPKTMQMVPFRRLVRRYEH